MGRIIPEAPDEFPPPPQARRLGVPVERGGLPPGSEERHALPGESPERLTAVEVGRAPFGNLLGHEGAPPGSALRVDPCTREIGWRAWQLPRVGLKSGHKILRGEPCIRFADRPPQILRGDLPGPVEFPVEGGGECQRRARIPGEHPGGLGERHVGEPDEGIHGDKPRERPERRDAAQCFVGLGAERVGGDRGGVAVHGEGAGFKWECVEGRLERARGCEDVRVRISGRGAARSRRSGGWQRC